MPHFYHGKYRPSLTPSGFVPKNWVITSKTSCLHCGKCLPGTIFRAEFIRNKEGIRNDCGDVRKRPRPDLFIGSVCVFALLDLLVRPGGGVLVRVNRYDGIQYVRHQVPWYTIPGTVLLVYTSLFPRSLS